MNAINWYYSVVRMYVQYARTIYIHYSAVGPFFVIDL